MDFHRASQLITSRTGAPSSYEPSADDIVEERVTALLQEDSAWTSRRDHAAEHPGFQALFEEIGISRAQVVQAGLLSNPVISGMIKFPGRRRASIDLGFSRNSWTCGRYQSDARSPRRN
jgi:cobalt-zinc-cadmium efflux system outer membrane protein